MNAKQQLDMENKIVERIEKSLESKLALLISGKQTHKKETSEIEYAKATERELCSIEDTQKAMPLIKAWVEGEKGFYVLDTVNIFSRKAHSGNVKFSIKSVYGKLYRKVLTKDGNVRKSKGN